MICVYSANYVYSYESIPAHHKLPKESRGPSIKAGNFVSLIVIRKFAAGLFHDEWQLIFMSRIIKQIEKLGFHASNYSKNAT
jgi:hypothetical protein